MAKQGATSNATAGGSGGKVTRKLEKARLAQQRAEHKVGKLRARLETAESKLAKRASRVSALQARAQTRREHLQPARAAKKRAKAQQVEHNRPAALDMVEPTEATAPVVAQDGASDESPVQQVGQEPSQGHGRSAKASHTHNSHAHKVVASDNLPTV